MRWRIPVITDLYKSSCCDFLFYVPRKYLQGNYWITHMASFQGTETAKFTVRFLLHASVLNSIHLQWLLSLTAAVASILPIHTSCSRNGQTDRDREVVGEWGRFAVPRQAFLLPLMVTADKNMATCFHADSRRRRGFPHLSFANSAFIRTTKMYTVMI